MRIDYRFREREEEGERREEGEGWRRKEEAGGRREEGGGRIHVEIDYRFSCENR